MKIASHLWKSPNGVFYFRETERIGGRQSSRRVSLRTKDPIQAKRKAVQLMAILANFPTKMTTIRRFELMFSNGNMAFKTDPNQPDDIEKLGRFLAENKNTLKELSTGHSLAASSIASPATPLVAQYSATYESLISKYEERKSKELAAKTLYQYLQVIKKFLAWAEAREGCKPLLMYQVDKKFVSQYIGYLQSNKYVNQTIDENYLRALNTFFDFAISIGEFPDIPAPSRGHKLKTSKHELISKVQREPFSIQDLQIIFNPENFLTAEHPDSHWLPLLALFTGARMNELCQLTVLDIHQEGGVPTINITDENGTLKTKASKRKIPVHHALVELGFLTYVADMKKFGSRLFPNLQADTFGSYIKEPSRRFGKYLDNVGISETSKVFHSFRATANNTLKQNGVTEEERCEFIGHEHDTVNTKSYTKTYDIQYLNSKVIPQLRYDIELSGLAYKKGMFDKFIARRLRILSKRQKIE